MHCRSGGPQVPPGAAAMQPNPQNRALDIAREALAVPESARDAFLRTRCGGNDDLLRASRLAVGTMLSATLPPAPGTNGERGHDTSPGPHADAEDAEEVHDTDAHSAPTIFGVASTSVDLFESGVNDAIPQAVLAAAGMPDRIGSYRVMGVLGEGGMGMVCLAEQERPRRTVALKVVRTGMMSAAMLKRFELESQVLGRLQHPGIAQVFEAGVAKVGPQNTPTPFFAMEYVRGQPLTDHARQHATSVRGRMELMARICDAVQHAHSRGVIHRDLKPGNVLVTADGQPKVLDFGIARATDSDIKATLQTDVGQLVGTLPYMSPEQVAGDAAALDTRSDVYTLGVILYELLAGRLPLDLSGRTIVEAARKIAQDDPAHLGDIEPSLRGDVSTIVAKAMEKDRQRRYQTASELAADIQRYLRDEPISARPPTTMYQLRKFTARHRGLVVGASSAVVLLILGVVGTSIGMARAIEQRRVAETQRLRADDEAKSAEALNDFIVNRMLAAATPEEAQGRQITVSEVVGNAAGEIDAAFADRPVVKAKLYDAVGKTYASLGEYDKAEKYMSGAVDMRRAKAPDSAELAAAVHALGSLRFRQARWAEAQALFDEAITLFAGTGKNDLELIEARSSAAACLRNLGKLDEAQRQQRLAIDDATARLGPDNATTLSAITNLAIVLHDGGHVAEAEKLYRQVLNARKRVLGMNHPSTLLALGNLSTALYDLGDIAGAEQVLAESLEIRKKVSGPDHPETILDMSNLAVMREKLGRVAEAETLIRETLEIAQRKLGPENESVAVLMSNLASNLAKQGKVQECETLFQKSVQILVKVDGADHAETIQTELGYARWLIERGRVEEAAPMLARVHATSSTKFGDEYPSTVGAAASLALLKEKMGLYDEALPLAEKALAGRTKLIGPDHPSTVESRDLVARLKARLAPTN